MNEGVEAFVNEVAFESAKSSINDCSSIPDKNHWFMEKNMTYWKIGGPSSVLDRSILECVILTLLVNCALNDPKMTHINFGQARMLSGARSLQNGNFRVFSKIKAIPVLSVEVPFNPSLFNTDEYNSHRHYATRCRLHQSRIQKTSFDWAKPAKLTIFVNIQINQTNYQSFCRNCTSCYY